MIASRDIDRHLILSTLFMVVTGLVMVYSASFIVSLNKFGDEFYYIKRQSVYLLIGITCFVCAMRIPYDLYRKFAYPILALAALLLIAIYIPGVGQKAGGATRWLDLGIVRFQPSELAKIAVIIFLAYSLESKAGKMDDFSTGFLPNIIIPGFIISLILMEPDFGSAVTLGILVVMLSFIGGAKMKHLGGLVVFSLPLLALVVYNFSYMMRRILIFLDPWKDPSGAGFQMVQSFLAFGAGGLTGAGLGEGKQKLFYLPEAHTDFIFSVIGEEFGLIGVALVVVMYLVFLISGMRIALCAKDKFGMFLALGLTFMIVLQAGINMAVVLGVLPPKGLPLPFISYGGTSLVVSLIAVGMILNVYIESQEKLS